MVSYSNRHVRIIAKGGSVVKNVTVSGRRIDVPRRTNWLEVAGRAGVYLACLLFCLGFWFALARLVLR